MFIVLSCLVNLIVCFVDFVVGLGIGWFYGCVVVVVYNVFVIVVIKVRILMFLGWMMGVMNCRGWIVENLFVYCVVF